MFHGSALPAGPHSNGIESRNETCDKTESSDLKLCPCEGLLKQRIYRKETE